MNRILSHCLLASLALSAGACSTPSRVGRTVGGSGELPLIEVSVRTLPGCPVRVPKHFQVLERMNSQGLVDMQIPVINPTSSPVKFRYSWQWMGPDGLSTTDPAREVWRTGFLEPKDSAHLTSTSTVADPTAVILRLSPSP